MQTFEDYLKNDIWESYGVLDDDMPDAFDTWCSELDVQQVMDYAENYGMLMYSKAQQDLITNGICNMCHDHT